MAARASPVRGHCPTFRPVHQRGCSVLCGPSSPGRPICGAGCQESSGQRGCWPAGRPAVSLALTSLYF